MGLTWTKHSNAEPQDLFGATESTSSFQQDPKGIYIVEITSEAQDGVAPAQGVASANGNADNFRAPADALLDQKPSQPVPKPTLGSIRTSCSCSPQTGRLCGPSQSNSFYFSLPCSLFLTIASCLLAHFAVFQMESVCFAECLFNTSLYLLNVFFNHWFKQWLTLKQCGR